MYSINRSLKILYCLVLIGCCFFSYGSFAYTNTHHSEKNEILTFEQVIKEESFLNEIESASIIEEFRIFVELSSLYTISDLVHIGKNVRSFLSYSGIAVTLSKYDIIKLVEEQKIASIWKNSNIYALDDNFVSGEIDTSRTICNFTDQIHAQYMWNKDYYGDDIKIAILDSGLKLDHPALSHTMDGISRIISSWNFIEDSSDVDDDYGHGTYIGGIIGSNGHHGYMQGVAPNSLFLIGKIIDSYGSGTVENMIEALDWAIENDADIINLSVGRPVSSLEAPEVEAVNTAVDSGVIVCVAAGNTRDTEEFGYNDLFTVLSPGIATQGIAVGAIDSNGILFEHSSAGPVAVNLNESTLQYLYDSAIYDKTWLKPDLVAPGVMINTTSTTVGSSKIVSGTSYATAVVSGLCSLLKQEFPEKKPSTIKGSLIESSIKQNIEVDSPVGDIEIEPSILYQGAGLPNSVLASLFLVNLPLVTIWPSEVPLIKQHLYINTQHTLIFHIISYGNSEDLEIEMSSRLSKIVTLSNVPFNLNEKQYDIELHISTEDCYSSVYNDVIFITINEVVHILAVNFEVVKGSGRMLFDFVEEADNFMITPYGSIYDILTYTQSRGFIPVLNTRDINHQSFRNMNLNDFETIALINFKNTSYHTYTSEDIAVLKDYITPDGAYSGGGLLVLPTEGSNLEAINNILQPVGLEYQDANISSHFLPISPYSYTILTNIPNLINQIYIPEPFDVIDLEGTAQTVEDRFAISSAQPSNGSLVIAANNIEMFLNSPYAYSSYLSDYDSRVMALNYAHNNMLLDNLIYRSSITNVNFTYEGVNEEYYTKDEITVKITVFNDYKPLSAWEFYATFERSDEVVARYKVHNDYGNGTYIISVVPAEVGLTGGEYGFSIRSPYGSESWTIQLIVKVSWGPIIVEASLITCIVYFLSFRKKKDKKEKEDSKEQIISEEKSYTSV